MRKRLLFPLLIAATFQAQSQPFTLVKDINTTNATVSSYADPKLYVGGITYFTATDWEHGRELWKTDGTPAGTMLVKDISPGEGSTSLYNFVALGSEAIFKAGNNLWKSDGTEAGTIEIFGTGQDINPPVVFNGLVYFATTSGVPAIWKTDGTVGGTVQVAVLESYAGPLYTAGNLVYFNCQTAAYGAELWKTDGTTAGTQLVADVLPGAGGGMASSAAAIGSTLFFMASDGNTGYELWKTDGTTAGTVLVKDIYSGTSSSNPFNLYNFNGTLYFSATTAAAGSELWKSNGTAAGTVMVADINPGSAHSNVNRLTGAGSWLYFEASTNNSGQRLWKTNGTAAGTTLATTYTGQPSYFTAWNNLLYAVIQGNLVKTDGTNVSALNPANTSAYGPMAAAGSQLFVQMSNSNAGIGQELYKTDGTVAGTTLVKDIRTATDNSNAYSYTEINGSILFIAYTPATGHELYSTDGTPSGTALVKDINGTASNSGISILVPLGNKAYFTANDGVTGKELWVTDGTTAGTMMVKDINPGASSSNPSNLTVFNGQLYFTAQDANGAELWKSDGTAAGTLMVKDIHTGSSSSGPQSFVEYNGHLYFGANDGIVGLELWRTDGSTAGTMLVQDINPGAGSSGPVPRLSWDGLLYFTATTSTYGNELWKTDGTSQGAMMVKDIRPGAAHSSVQNLTIHSNHLYFITNLDSYTPELWKTDGTEAGTELVNQHMGGQYSYINQLFSVGSRLCYVFGNNYYSYYNSYTYPYLYSTDGTTANTDLLHSFPMNYQPNSFVKAGNHLLFSGFYNNTTNTELMKTDGTVAGTGLYADLAPENGVSSSPTQLTLLSGSRLLLSANINGSGGEPYIGPITDIPLPVTLVSFAGRLAGQDALLEWETANEVNMAGYTVERSRDGALFHAIGSATPKGRLGKTQYRLTDYGVGALGWAKAYYRLRMEEADKNYSYSATVALPLPAPTTAGQFNLIQNDEEATLVLAPEAQHGAVALYDAAGRQVLRAQLASGRTRWTMRKDRLAPGIYILQVDDQVAGKVTVR